MTMGRRPETHFAWNGTDALAYQVIGDGTEDLVYLQGLVSNVEMNWAHPAMREFLTGLARSRRLVVSDVRGMGCSERSSPREVWPLEVIMEDIRVLLDAVGSDRATLIATQECAFAATMFAVTYPDRTNGLVLYEAAANWLWSPETPWEWTVDQWRAQANHIKAWSWANARDAIRKDMPSMAGDASFLDWWYRYVLLSTSPGYWEASAGLYSETDIRPLLPAIQVPVLVMTRPGHPEPSWPLSSEYLANHIPGARLVPLPGRDAPLWMGDNAPVLTAIDRFLGTVANERDDLERVVMTVLVTDMVGSTATAHQVGDREWRVIVERHHATVRALLNRYRGAEVDTAGDGFLAAFDGPARAVRCARAIVDSMAPLGIIVRAGLHTGEVETIDGKIGGIALSIGARIASLAGPSEVLVSQTVKDLVAGSGLTFESRGTHVLKGLADSWSVHRVIEPVPGL
ncbi:MAG TPA: adenylate/guanylate cyclase domain-containing protein [Candidatus Limnocylindria bacterium]